MDFPVVLAIVVVLALVVLVISAPLRNPPTRAGDEGGDSMRVADLRAAKEAKYREIRDAEMDYRTGKLSEADYGALDRQLRAEAIAILRELDGLEAAARN
jgi:hypothetical protein